MFLISVIIPVKNGEISLGMCLSAIKNQSIAHMVEIIILDSGSTDNSVFIAESYGAKVISIDPLTFNHGLTRNIGVNCAHGELLYFTVQDAELSNEFTLERMVRHFDDVQVSGIVGIQGCPWNIKKNPALWFEQFDIPVVETRYYPNGTFGYLPVNEQFQLSNWDNVNAMYRKVALIDLPFTKTNFSEDWIWANNALKSGKKILRDPSILVWHYHHMDFGYVIKSKFIVNYYFKVFFNRFPNLYFSLMPFFRRCYTLIYKRDNLCMRDKFFWIFHNSLCLFGGFISVLLFKIFYLISGQKGLDWLYVKLCSRIPQGKFVK